MTALSEPKKKQLLQVLGIIIAFQSGGGGADGFVGTQDLHRTAKKIIITKLTTGCSTWTLH